MDNAKPIQIRAKLYWANLAKVNEMSGKYQVDLGNLSGAAIKALETLGLEVKNKGDEREFFITCKSQHAIRAYNKDSSEITDRLVGKGSEGIAVIGAYAWSFKNKKGISPSIKKLTVTTLVEFSAVDDVESVESVESVEAGGVGAMAEDEIL